MTADELKFFLQKAFANTIENMSATDKDYATYFSPDYIQLVDGKELNYEKFVLHMKAQKAVMATVKVTFKHIVAEGDKVATVHIVEGHKKDGGFVKGQVNAFFQIKDNKIVHCNELSHLIQGSDEDKDLGSRH